MSTTEMVNTFRQAADVIRAGGLAKRAYHSGSAHCTVGALMVVKQNSEWDSTIVMSEIGYLVKLLGGPDKRYIDSDITGFCTITHWNDETDRTADDVVTLLEQAAEKLEADLHTADEVIALLEAAEKLEADR